MDDSFIRIRRGLNAISIAIIVYFLAGGEIIQLQHTNVGMVLTKPNVAKAIVWLAYFYFLWRFFMFSAPARKRFELARSLTLASIAGYRRRYKSREADDLYCAYLDKGLFKRAADHGRQFTPISSTRLPPERIPIFRFKLMEKDNVIVPLFRPFLICYWYEFLADCKACATKKKSLDYILTLALAFGAIGSAYLWLLGAV